jgi:hypothetical protein
VGFTGVLAVSTIGLWVVTYLASRKQSRDMKASIAVASGGAETAHRFFVADQRPWVSFVQRKIELLSGFECDVNGVNLRMKFPIENSGRTPAQGVSIDMRLYPGGLHPPTDPGVERDRLIAEIKQRPRQLTQVLFPGDETEFAIRTSINQQEIDRINQTDFKMIFPVVIAIISYEFTFEPGVHVTGLIQRVGKTPPTVGIAIADLPVAVQDLHMQMWPRRSGYAD